jgi:type II secretory pathway pseudopilin PulG
LTLRAAGSRRRARSERGSTLVEVLIAMAIMGTAVVAIIAGMSSLFTSSGQGRQSTTAGIVARDYAEALQLAVAQPNVWCSTSYTVVYTPPSGYSVTPSYSACPVNNSSTPQFQTVTLTVTEPNTKTETLRMAVRKP